MTDSSGSRKRNEFAYYDFVESEDLPVHRASIGIEDVTALPRAPWRRLGGNAAFIELTSTFQSERSIYVADIPGGGELAPEKHLYHELIFILRGHGLSQVWQGTGKKLTFEWARGSVFAFPPNTSHVLVNGSEEPVVFLALTTAPRVMNALGETNVVFESDYPFVDLYREENYFHRPWEKIVEGWYRGAHFTANFIPDVYKLALDDHEQKVAGGQLTTYQMGPRFHGHISEWPSGRYHKAHYHGPGAILLGLSGEGYVLAWSSKLGPQPYATGHADEVTVVHWGENSIYSPPDGYFHQHFNLGAGPARHFAVHAEHLPLGVHDLEGPDGWQGYRSLKEGGTLIEYEDEDDRVRRDFQEQLRARGIESMMQAVSR